MHLHTHGKRERERVVLAFHRITLRYRITNWFFVVGFHGAVCLCRQQLPAPFELMKKRMNIRIISKTLTLVTTCVLSLPSLYLAPTNWLDLAIHFIWSTFELHEHDTAYLDRKWKTQIQHTHIRVWGGRAADRKCQQQQQQQRRWRRHQPNSRIHRQQRREQAFERWANSEKSSSKSMWNAEEEHWTK